MQSSKNSTSTHSPLFFDKNTAVYKQFQSKSKKNLNISLGANETLHSLNPNVPQSKVHFQSKHEFLQNMRIKTKEDERNPLGEFNNKLNSVIRQNQKLKQQNELLRKELSNMKKQKNQIFYAGSQQKYRVVSREHSREGQSGDLRGTLKKQYFQVGGDLKQLKIKLEILSKQCKMYEQIIEKMQNTIRRLTDQNKLFNSKHKVQQRQPNKNIRKQEFQNLKDKVNLVMKEYSDLESKMHSNELEWVIWKEQWVTEKNIYLNKIRQLELKIKEKKGM